MARQLVLLGAGAAHVEFLDRWARQAVPGVQVMLITRQKRFFDPLMLPYWLESLTESSQIAIDIEAVAHRAKASWPDAQVADIDTASRTLRLEGGQTLRYDWISTDLEPQPSRALTDAAIPGARRNGLFVQPVEPFLALWPKVLTLAQSRPISLAVIADTQGGWPALALCLALRLRLPGAAITLVTGGLPLAHGRPEALREHLARLLRQRNITVLADTATTLEPGDLHLQSGARLACDVPLLCTRTHEPQWLTASGLAQGGITGAGVAPTGLVDVVVGGSGGADAMRSFASPADHTRALMAAVSGRKPARALAPATVSPTLIPAGGSQALMGWGPGGRWVWQGYAPGWLARRRATRLWRLCQGQG